MKRLINKKLLWPGAMAAMIFAAGCSTTKRLASDEILYTGIRRTAIESMTKEEVHTSVKSAIQEPLNVRPNNPLFSPYVRTPFPIGLWAWNHLYTDRQTGFKSWLYRRFSREPVLISKVQPAARVGMVIDILDNHGYFGSTGGFDIITARNNLQKARLRYNFQVARPWFYSSVEFPAPGDDATTAIASLQESSNIQPGSQYNIDTLINERIRITEFLRDRGYYYFRPDYLEYLADTTVQRYMVDLKMIVAPGVPPAAMRPYTINDVNVFISSATGLGDFDSMELDGMKVVYQNPLKVRPKVLQRSITVRPGQKALVGDINTTFSKLTRLGIFRFANVEATPLDSLRGNDSLNLYITTAMNPPFEAEFGVDFSSLSSSFVGPGANFSLKHRNLFKGGELFVINFNSSYQWQTGNRRLEAGATAINSYEFGINSSIIFPVLATGISGIARRIDGRTIVSAGGNIMNRPRFFTMASANMSLGYDFQTSKQSFHNLTLFRLVYTKMLRTTEEFRNTIAEKPAIERSFQDQFIPSMAYTYTLDRLYGFQNRHRIIWQSTAIQAGNILAGISGANRGDKKIFGNKFSQFVKGYTELRHFLNVGHRQTIATRFFIGAGYAYGNSTELPYSEQFHIGGANSIRAFTIRSIGPGSQPPDTENRFGYFDQTGDFKLELNVEYRFGIVGGLNGAVFMDTGNIWLLRNDPDRPKGLLGSGDFFNELALGTGAGLRFDFSFLVLRADLGIGLHLPYDTGKSGYYNIPNFRDGLGFHLAIGYPF